MGTDDNGVIHPFYLTSDIEGGYGTKSDYEAQVRSIVNLFKETHVYLCMYIHVYPQWIRLQRRFYGNCSVHFLAFRVLCRPKLAYFCA